MATKSYSEVVREDAPEIFLRLDESSGSTAADTTRFGRDFTHAGSPTLDQTGPVSKAVSYDGTDDETTYAVNMPITAYPFTIEAWLQAPGSPTTSTSYSRVDIGDASVDTDGAYIELLVDGSDDLNVRCEVENGGTEDTADFRIPNTLKGEWVHVAAQYVSATERNVYANGALIGTDATSISFPANLDKVALGNVARTTPDFVSGLIAEVALYNYQLGGDRIRIHHAVGRGHTDTDLYGYAVMTEGPNLYATLGDASGNAEDSSGNKRTLTAAGTPTYGATGPLSESGGDDAVTFDGTDDEFSLAADDLNITAYPLTIEVFGKTPAAPGNSTSYSRVEFGDDGTRNNLFGVDLRTDGSGNVKARGLLSTGGTADNVTGYPVLVADQFFHIVWQLVSATERNLYVNGDLVVTDTTSRSFGSNINDVVIGRDLASSASFFAGTTGQVSIYGRDIGDTAIRDHYAKAKQYLESDYRTTVLAKCPFIYWRLGESSGTTATDETEFGRDGTYEGSPTLGESSALSGDANTSTEFDGTDDGCVLDEQVVEGYPFTMEAWMRLPDTPSSSTTYMAMGLTASGGTAQQATVTIKTDSDTEFVANNRFSGGVTADTDYETGGKITNFHHIVFAAHSATDKRMYVNGVHVGTDTTDPGLTFSNLTRVCVGKKELGGGFESFHAGKCDEFAFYRRRALSAEEVRDNYVSGLGYHDRPQAATGEDAYLRTILMDAPSMFFPSNETSGTTASDATRYGRDATYSGGFTLDEDGPSTDIGLKSVLYDGTDGEARYSSTTDYPISGYPVTIEAWVKSISVPSGTDDYSVIHLTDSSNNEEFALNLKADGSGSVYARFFIRQGGGSTQTISQNSGTGISAQNGEFVHVAVVCRSATDRELYVNGRSVGTDTNSVTFPAPTRVGLGAFVDSSAAYTEGHIGYVAIYDDELTEAKIRSHFMGGRAIFDADNPYLYELGQLAPATHYRLNESSGSTAADLLGLRDLTIAGSPTLNQTGPIHNVDDDAAIQLDGTDDEATVADDAEVSAYPFAITGWIKTSSGPGNSEIFAIMGMGDDGTGSNYAAVALETDGSGNVTPTGFFATGGTADNLQPTSPIIEADVFHHVTLVCRSSTDRELYVNGASVSTDTTSRTFPSNMDDILIGRDAAASPAYSSGSVSEFSIITTDVSDSEALNLYLAGFESLQQDVAIPMGELSATGQIDVLADLFSIKELSFASLGMLTLSDDYWGIRVEINGEVTKDFRNVQTFRGAIGIVAQIDGAVSAEITTSRSGQIDIIVDIDAQRQHFHNVSGQIDSIVEIEADESFGTTSPEDSNADDLAIIVRPVRQEYIVRPRNPNISRKR